MRRMSILHQNSGGIGKSVPIPNTSLVLVEHGYNLSPKYAPSKERDDFHFQSSPLNRKLICNIFSVWKKYQANCHMVKMVEMDQTLDQNGSRKSNNVKATMTARNNGEKSNKCNQCNYASSDAGKLRKHLKTHTGEKSNKCSQCEYTSSHAGEGNI